jgi:hypothetical protein
MTKSKVNTIPPRTGSGSLSSCARREYTEEEAKREAEGLHTKYKQFVWAAEFCLKCNSWHVVRLKELR